MVVIFGAWALASIHPNIHISYIIYIYRSISLETCYDSRKIHSRKHDNKKNTPNPHQSQARCCIPTRGAQDEVAVCTSAPAKRSTRIPRFELEESFLCICAGLYKVSLITFKRKQQVPPRWHHPSFIFHHHSSSLHTLAAHFHLLPVQPCGQAMP